MSITELSQLCANNATNEGLDDSIPPLCRAELPPVHVPPPLQITSLCSSSVSRLANPSSLITKGHAEAAAAPNRAQRVRGCEGLRWGSRRDSSMPERWHSGAVQALCWLQPGWPGLAGCQSFLPRSGCVTWPGSAPGVCCATEALRGAGSPVPHWGALPEPPPAAPGSCRAVKVQPCPAKSPAAPPVLPYVPRVFSSLSRGSLSPAGSLVVLAEPGCGSKWPEVIHGCHTGTLFVEALGSP